MPRTRATASSLILVLALAAWPATAESPAASARDLVASERAFAEAAAASGMRAAFLEFLSPSGIVFRPGPVLGRAWFEASRASAALLAWQPWHAELSASGDLGWTTGPWTIRRDSSSTGVDDSGEYVSVWRREADRWRVVIDGGISHARHTPASEATLTELPARPRGGAGPLARRESMWRADAEFAKLAAAGTTAQAVQQLGADRLILLRSGMPRVAGLLAAHDSLAARAETPAMMSNAQFISEAGDLGYTYGSFVTATPAGPDSSWYLNIWRQGETRRWELALHLVMPGAAR